MRSSTIGYLAGKENAPPEDESEDEGTDSLGSEVFYISLQSIYTGWQIVQASQATWHTKIRFSGGLTSRCSVVSCPSVAQSRTSLEGGGSLAAASSSACAGRVMRGAWRGDEEAPGRGFV